MIDAKKLAKWHEDDGPVTWWALGDNGRWLGEPAGIGTPNDSDWPGYHTHWTPHPAVPLTPDQVHRRQMSDLRDAFRDAGLLSY